MLGLAEPRTEAEIIARYKQSRQGMVPRRPLKTNAFVNGALSQTRFGALVVDKDGRPHSTPRKTLDRIKQVVCRHFKVTKTDLCSARRTAHLVRPRQIAMYLGRHYTPRSTTEIGRALGNRDHTTVIHGERKIAALRALFPDLDAELCEMEAQVFA